MCPNVSSVEIIPGKGVWPEGNWFWGEDKSEFSVISTVDGVFSFYVVIPKMKIHEDVLPLRVNVVANGVQCSREIHKAGSFRVQCAVHKNEHLNLYITCSTYVVPDNILHNGDKRRLSVALRDFSTIESVGKSNYNFDYLVYSSHKTATQSIVASLKTYFGDENIFFCHRLDDLSLVMLHDHVVTEKIFFVDLKLLVDSFYKLYNKPLKVISTYREPESRLISSFFQTMGDDAVKYGGKQVPETVLYRLKDRIEELVDVYNNYLAQNILEGYYESIDLIFNDLIIDVEKIMFNRNDLVLSLREEAYYLYLIRFDILTSRFKEVLSSIVGENIELCSTNLSTNKWYSEIYQKFKEHYHYPQVLKEKIFTDKEVLHKLFY